MRLGKLRVGVASATSTNKEKEKYMKLLLFPFKLLWWLIKISFKILGFIFRGVSIKGDGLFGRD